MAGGILTNLYSWFWFHTEFWLTPIDRRPYTFIWRDWIYRHMAAFVVMVVVWYAGVITLSVWHGTIATMLSTLSSLVLAHLVWGSKWIEEQQEQPHFLG